MFTVRDPLSDSHHQVMSTCWSWSWK